MARLRRISGSGLLALALALTALGLAFGAPGRADRPELQLAAAGGSLSLSNSKDGEAVFTAAGMQPGGQVSGTVQIANTGALPGALAVARTAGADEVPGTGGGLLSTRLILRVLDVTSASAPVEVWAGKLAAMPRVGIGVLPAGQQRAYRFEATMPAGTGDNAFQGAELSVGFLWTAVASEPTPTPTATPAAPAPPPAVTEPPVVPAAPALDGAALGAELFALPAARRCVSGRKLAVTIRRPAGAGFSSVTIRVNRKTTLKLKGAKALNVRSRVILRKLPKGKLKVSVAALLTDGRQAVATRVYKACAKKR